MDAERDFRGYYCRRCHTYSRLYRQGDEGDFSGVCPKCGDKLTLPAAYAEEGLFFSGASAREATVNLWDSYYQRKIVATVARGTGAGVLETVRYNGVTWYRVRAGKHEGWVSGSFIRRVSPPKD